MVTNTEPDDVSTDETAARLVEDALADVAAAQEAFRAARAARIAAMDRAYAAGATTSAIGHAAGIPKSAAWQAVLGRRDRTQTPRTATPARA